MLQVVRYCWCGAGGTSCSGGADGGSADSGAGVSTGLGSSGFTGSSCGTDIAGVAGGTGSDDGDVVAGGVVSFGSECSSAGFDDDCTGVGWDSVVDLVEVKAGGTGGTYKLVGIGGTRGAFCTEGTGIAADPATAGDGVWAVTAAYVLPIVNVC